MRQLEELTMKQVTDYIIDQIADEKGVNKALARKLVINALCYNLVINEISSQIDYILEIEEE